jgi:hypothetical protein
MMTPEGSYDEALQRLHAKGPEFEGWLSNHGPMAVEALARRGFGPAVHSWTDDYLDRLDDAPRARFAIESDGWRDPLGDPSRSGDWIAYFTRAVAEQPWSQVVTTWWPRLLPGIAAGATHGVIRLGHALRAIRDHDTEPRRAEVAHALAYWAARWQPLPLVVATGTGTAAAVLAAVPPVTDQRFGIRHRLRRLDPRFGETATTLARPATPAQVTGALSRLVDEAVHAYPRIAHGNPTMLVHAVTAPNAVLAALPSLPPELWQPSFDAAWTATAVMVAAYRPASQVADLGTASRNETRDGRTEEVFAAAAAHGGEHVVKLADAALDGYARTGDPAATAAVEVAVRLDA